MELTIEEALRKGVEAHRAGNAVEADKYYTAILGSQPNHPDANHNMGVLAVGVGKVEEALPFFKKALDANATVEQFWLSYIDALIKLNRQDDARAALGEARASGQVGDKLIQLEEQLSSTGNVSGTKNGHFTAPSNQQLNSLLRQYESGNSVEAEKLARSLAEQFPNHQFAWKVLGAILKQTGRIDESLFASQKSVQLGPRDAEAHSNLGNVLRELGRLQEAKAREAHWIATTVGCMNKNLPTSRGRATRSGRRW